MKFLVDSKALKISAARVQGTIADRSLSQIGIRTEDGKVCFSSADRILAVYTKVDCRIEQPGTVFVPGKLFIDIAKEIPESTVTIQSASSNLIITAGVNGQFEMKIPLIEESEWRDVPEINATSQFTIESDRLSYMIEQVQFCVAQESPRNYGAVGYLHNSEKDKIRLVGTDGFRLSYCEVDVKESQKPLKNGICLSKTALTELHRMCNEGFEKVDISIDEEGSSFCASLPDYQIFVRLSSVKYPKYQNVLPSANLNIVKVSRPQLQSVTKRVLLASDKSRALQLTFSDSQLTVRSRTQGTSEGRESLPLPDFKGIDQGLYVNGKFLIDVFSTISSDELKLQFKSENDPILIVPDMEPKHCKSIHVLVPIKES